MNLEQWLDYILCLHPNEIDHGLARVQSVARRLGLTRPAPLVITVAGTNGKGSCVALLDSILHAANYRVGCYTSPHLLQYNERVVINGIPVTDTELCESFELIEKQRGDISLSYFEFSTLSALLVFQQQALDLVVLEVGLGGRLDAVNIISADVAIISSIDLDHQDWLGNSKESIAREKAGILREGKPVVVGEIDFPHIIGELAADLNCPLFRQGKEFKHTHLDPKAPADSTQVWNWQGKTPSGADIELQELPVPALHLDNAATVLQALKLMPLGVSHAAVVKGLATVQLCGRQQSIRDHHRSRNIILDVAHNVQAARYLANNLKQIKQNSDNHSRLHLVLAMMSNKDHSAFFKALESVIDIWYIAEFPLSRCLEAKELYGSLNAMQAKCVGPFASVPDAYVAACHEASEEETVVVSGSFFTVSEVLPLLDLPESGGQ